MLEELRIRGLGVIEDAVLPLGPGLTVVTGETGAGKTMVVTGLMLLFGGRADPARVRTGADQAVVDGRLVLEEAGPVADRVRDAGGQLDVGADAESGAPETSGRAGTAELLLRRVIASSGRSRAYVGGAPAPVGVLAELAESLVAVHGQADQVRLARPGAQRDAVDRYGGIDRTPLADAFARWQSASADLADRVARSADLRREAEILARGLEEIERAAPQPGEDADLRALAQRLSAADTLRIAARTAHDALLGNDDAVGDQSYVSQLVSVAGRAVVAAQQDDPQLGAFVARLRELAALTAELGADLAAYAADVDADPQRLDQVESRRAELASLVRRYCDEPDPSVDGVLRWAERAAQRLADIDVSDDAIAELRARRDEAARETAKQASEVSAARRQAGERLAAAVTAELAALAMGGAEVTVEVRPRPAVAGQPVLRIDQPDPPGPPGAGTGPTVGPYDGAIGGGESGTDAGLVGVGPDGADDVAVLLRPHPGAPALPLGRGASGGELSRVMLAVEVCMSRTEPVPTMIFDEVDAGVGGRAAVEVGRRLARLAADHQVLVVTHLAQVAAFADRHVVVDKPTGAGRAGSAVTASDVRVVEGPSRVAELARMLGGSETATARDHAAELLADAAAGRAV